MLSASVPLLLDIKDDWVGDVHVESPLALSDDDIPEMSDAGASSALSTRSQELLSSSPSSQPSSPKASSLSRKS